MSQITIRDIPEAVEKAIRERARKRNTSLDRIVIELVEEALGMSGASGKNRDLSQLAGTWDAEDAESFDADVESIRRIDGEIWD